MDMQNETASSQYLSFTLRDEDFAVEIFKVREVLDVATLTRIPRMPSYLCGVINLRGNVVPVVDLGLKLGMEPVKKTINTCIMIMEIVVEAETAPVLMGVLTDAVQAVLELDRANIEAVPRMGTNLNTDFIKGMGRYEEKFLILLDIDKVLASEGEASLRDVESGALATQALEAEAHLSE
ncbi:MAG: chemotaxis protein CheW [Proteobacteria bacterium]|nr:chemotaxis protein CheW [Pseudomonadota bacterium]MBU0964947.1 chemotaxis protein CheW [Pseudomonadota bacterium]